MGRVNAPIPVRKIAAGADTYKRGFHKGDPGGLDAIDTDLAAGNIKKDVVIFGVTGVHVDVGGLTVYAWLANPATGTLISPERINENYPDQLAVADSEGEYAEVDFGGTFNIRQFKHYGSTLNTGDGVWKIEYYDGSWHDWETGIATRTTNDWSGWITPAAGIKACSKIRLTCTTRDTSTSSKIGELEIGG